MAPPRSQTPRFALITDTHNLFGPDAPAFFAGDDRSVHGGDIAKLNLAAAGAKVRVVVSGHSPKPSTVERDVALFINPGNGGPSRLKLPISVGELLINSDRRMTPRRVTLV